MHAVLNVNMLGVSNSIAAVLPGMLHARAIVDRHTAARRNEVLMRLAVRYYA